MFFWLICFAIQFCFTNSNTNTKAFTSKNKYSEKTTSKFSKFRKNYSTYKNFHNVVIWNFVAASWFFILLKWNSINAIFESFSFHYIFRFHFITYLSLVRFLLNYFFFIYNFIISKNINETKI